MEKIKLSGINRDPRSEDQGACQELINMRFRDGSLVPVGKKNTLKKSDGSPAEGLPKMSVIFIHTIDADTDLNGDVPYGKNYLGYNSTSGNIVTWEPTNPNPVTPHVIGYIGDKKTTNISFTAIKNMVVIIDKVDKKLCYLLWKDSAYTFIAKKFPDMPAFGITTTNVYNVTNHPAVNGDSFRAAYGSVLTEWRKTGYDEGIVLVRYAFEMFDGSIVNHSVPIMMSLGGTGRPDNSSILTTKIVSPGKFQIWMSAGKPSFTCWTLGDLTTTYKHIIKSIVFYMTKPVPSNKVNEMGFADNLIDFNPGLVNGTPFKEVVNQEIYYKIHSVSPSDIQTGIPIDVNPGDLNSWESKEIMPQDDFTHHTMSASASLVYNGRLLLGDATTKLFDGFDPLSFFHGNNPPFINEVPIYYLDIYTKILTEEGEKTVKASSLIPLTSQHLVYPALLSYPDIRASEMKLVKRVGDVLTLIDTFQLSQNPNHNLAQCLIQQDLATPKIIDLSLLVPVTFVPPAEMKNTFSDSNVVKMSALNNPMQFPSKNTYSVGLSRIVGFETNALPISQGQYGQFPIFVFTDARMWAMELGQGGTTIATVVPLNEFICNNPNTITKIDKSILFSTNEGLILLQGSEDTLLSQPLRGEFLSPIRYNAEVEGFINNTELVQVIQSVSQVDFNEFLLNAKIGYDCKHRELIVSNSSYYYSYVYSFDSKTWTKISEKFTHFINDFPSYYAVRSDDRMVDLTTEDELPVDALVMTRPMDSGDLVKLIRLGVKASVDTNEKITGLYLFGSVDGREWSFVSGIQQRGKFNNPYVNRALMSFQYSIVIMAGNMNPTTFINEMNIELKYKYTNKTIR